MDYISERYSPETILKSAQRIALPGGDEGESVQGWIEEAGWEYPVFEPKECLHRGR